MKKSFIFVLILSFICNFIPHSSGLETVKIANAATTPSNMTFISNVINPGTNPDTNTKARLIDYLGSKNTANYNYYTPRSYNSYSKYPKSVTYTDAYNNIVTQQLRENCKAGTSNSVYRVGEKNNELLPWLGEYDDGAGHVITNQQSNDFLFNETPTNYYSCSRAAFSGGKGVWLPPQVPDLWAMPSNSSYVGKSANWTYPTLGQNQLVDTDQMNNIFTIKDLTRTWYSEYNDDFDLIDHNIGKVSDPNSPFRYADHQQEIFGRSSGVTSTLHLRSSGTALMRLEFDLSDAQRDEMNLGHAYIEIISAADDFQKIHINGISNTTTLVRNTIKPSSPSGGCVQPIVLRHDRILGNLKGTQCATDPIDVAGGDEINTAGYNFQSTNNVIAWQVNDKAVWTAGQSSNSNTAGLAFQVDIKFTAPTPPPSGSCNVSATPTKGLAPLVVRIDANPINLPDTTTYNYTVEPGVTIPNRGKTIYYTYPSTMTSPTDYYVSAETSDHATSCGPPYKITVSPPRGSSGSEVAP